MEKIYTVTEAVELLKLHRNTIINMIGDGRIKSNKISGQHGKHTIAESEIKRLRGE